jgi:hypothetical protein
VQPVCAGSRISNAGSNRWWAGGGEGAQQSVELLREQQDVEVEAAHQRERGDENGSLEVTIRTGTLFNT